MANGIIVFPQMFDLFSDMGDIPGQGIVIAFLISFILNWLFFLIKNV